MIKVMLRDHLDLTAFDAEKVHYNEIGQIFELHTDGEIVALIPAGEVVWIKIEQEAEVAT